MGWIKKVKKIGNSVGITFDKEEQELHTIQEGTILDLTDLVVLPKKRLLK